MKKSILVLTFILIPFCLKEAFAQGKIPQVRIPFLTFQEEMKVRGIKPSAGAKPGLKSLKEINLSGIIYGVKKIAIINSDFYTEGDSIGKFTIKEIKPLSIILKSGNKETELKLKNVLVISSENAASKSKEQSEKKDITEKSGINEQQ